MNRIMRWILLGLLGMGATVIGIEVWHGQLSISQFCRQ